MQLILARHGNTFEPGQTPFQVGRFQDLSLVATGREQAKKLAEYLKRENLVPSIVYAAPLKRTLEYAQIVAKCLSLPLPVADVRLSELDYGNWAGLTEEQIVSKFGADELKDWTTKGIWPENAGWQDEESQIIQETISFAIEITKKHSEDEKILVVSSNGRLRYFLDLIPKKREQFALAQQLKVRTGAYCLFNYSKLGWNLVGWNCLPE